MRRLLSAGAFILLCSGGGAFLLVHTLSPEATYTPPPRCIAERANDFQCWKKKYESATKDLGVTATFGAMKDAYQRNGYVISQCHQLAHVIGNTAAELNGSDVARAFADGDSFCWSGYYHGVIERAVGLLGRSELEASLDGLCANIPGKGSYSFDYYNCVHGLGHGVMAITRNELFESLVLCDALTGTWEQQSCQGGVFMENVMADNRNHFTKYLKGDDLTYPCNAVDDRYKYQCYLMQTSYMLAKNGRDFTDVFQRCATADENYRDTCAESAGRDASGGSVSDTETTLALCSLALNERQEEHCLIGAVKDFVSYFHDDTRARELCMMAPQKFTERCLATVDGYYATF